MFQLSYKSQNYKQLINKMSTSSLLPSPLLSPLSALSPTQQKVLRNYGTYLNLQKYVDGKKLYLAFIQAKSQKDGNRYKNFIKQFQSHNYVSKMLHISSMKYYRDIKTLLIGGVPDAGIREHLRYKYIDINQVIIELDAAAYVEDVVIEKRKSKLIKNQQLKSESQIQQNIIQNTQVNQTNSTISNFKKHGRKFLSSSTINDEQSAKIKRKQQQFKNSRKILMKPQKSFAQQQFVLTYSPDANEQSQRSYKQSQLKIIKLIKVQNKQDRTRSVKSQRNYVYKSTLPLKSGSVDKNKESISVYKTHIKNAHVTPNLEQNKLYHQRHQWKMHNKKQIQFLQIPKLKKKQSREKKQITETGNICDKILAFIKSLGILKNLTKPRVQKSKDLQESKPLINKSKYNNLNVTKNTSNITKKKLN